MREQDAMRLASIGLLVPGLSERDHFDLAKAGRVENPFASPNRGTYFSDLGDDWSYWGAGSPDRKPGTTVPFNVLREKFKASPLDSIIVMRRQMQVRKVANRCLVPGKQVGFRVVHERYADPNFQPSESTDERCRIMERLLCNVSRDVARDFKQFASMAIKEELTIDRKVMLRFLDDETGKPVGYSILDGATVLPRITVLLPFMKRLGITNIDEAASQYSDQLYAQNVRDDKGKTIDLTKAAWIQVVQEQIKGAWTRDEMDVDITNRDVEIDQILYGRSAFEQSLALTDLFVSALAYNFDIFSPNFPEGIIALSGAYDKKAIEGFKRTILMQTNAGGHLRTPIIPADDPTFKLDYKKLRDLPKDALFTELLRILIAFKTAAYGMHPSEINFSPDGGGKTAMINEEDEGQAQEAATADGFNSMLDNLASWLTVALIRPYYDDLIVIWDGLSTDHESARIDLNVKRVESYWTLEQTRSTENNEKLVIPDDPADWDLTQIPLNQNLVQLAQLKQEAKQMKMQQQAQMGMQQAPEDADYGEESGDDWHQAGQGPAMDHGAEPPNWQMMGQTDKQGEPVKMQRPAGAGDETNKSLKYLRVLLEDEA